MDPCSSKDEFLETFEAYLQEERKQVTTDSLFFDETYKELVNDCYKKFRPELSLEERQDFWTQSLKYHIKDLEGDIDINFGKSMEDPFNKYVTEEVKALIKDSGMSFLFELQTVFKDDLDNLMKLFASELNNLADELQNLFE